MNSTVFTTRITSQQCPSDSVQTFSVSSLAALGVPAAFTYSASKGNYGVNWGNTDNGQWSTSGSFPTLYRNQTLLSAQTVRFASITDGLSNTQFVSEILQGAQDDVRGTIWVDDACAGAYQTRFTPNGTQDILQVLGAWAGNGTINVDNVPGGASAGTITRLQPRDGRHAVRQPVSAVGYVRYTSEGARTAVAKPPSWWSQYSLWDGPFPCQELDQPHDMGRARIDLRRRSGSALDSIEENAVEIERERLQAIRTRAKATPACQSIARDATNLACHRWRAGTHSAVEAGDVTGVDGARSGQEWLTCRRAPRRFQSAVR